jgi:glycine/D-amino acid oxidase-like deaminating enzyme
LRYSLTILTNTSVILKMIYDFILAGQGLAGTILALTLQQAGKTVLVVDDNKPSNSSKVAAGIFNPVTGRKLYQSWHAEALFPFLKEFYSQAEELLQAKFYYEKNIYRPFSSVEDANFSAGRMADPAIAPYIETNPDSNGLSAAINNPYGGFETHGSGFVEVRTFLKAARAYFEKTGCMVTGLLDPAGIQLHEDCVEWNKYKSRHLIFCQGFEGVNNPFFGWLPFRPVKGETLDIKLEQPLPEKLFNRGAYIVPAGPDLYKVGATYVWHRLDSEPTPEGRADLEEKLKILLKAPFTVVGQDAGVRPATRDRRPFIGLHPGHKRLGIFNGLGTKGVSLAPYWAHHFAEHLRSGSALHPEVDIQRFISLYFQQDSTP